MIVNDVANLATNCGRRVTRSGENDVSRIRGRAFAGETDASITQAIDTPVKCIDHNEERTLLVALDAK
jgi:hypothetical protein